MTLVQWSISMKGGISKGQDSRTAVRDFGDLFRNNFLTVNKQRNMNTFGVVHGPDLSLDTPKQRLRNKI